MLSGMRAHILRRNNNYQFIVTINSKNYGRKSGFLQPSLYLSGIFWFPDVMEEGWFKTRTCGVSESLGQVALLYTRTDKFHISGTILDVSPLSFLSGMSDPKLLTPRSS